MKKLFSLILCLAASISAVFAADLKFVQVDSLKYNPSNLGSVNSFEKFIDNINSQKDVSFIVFSGNNIVKATDRNLLAFLKAAKRLKAPCYVILGSKDVDKQKGMSKVHYMELAHKYTKSPKSSNYVFKKKGLVFIVVDGAKEVIPMSNGYYRDDVLDWLDHQLLKYAKKKVIILQHFAVVPPAQKEARYTYKPEEYMKVLAKHTNVMAIFAGNFGVSNEQKVNDVLHVATGDFPEYRMVDILEYDTENPTIWSEIKR